MGGLCSINIVNNVDNDRKLEAHISEGDDDADHSGERRELER